MANVEGRERVALLGGKNIGDEPPEIRSGFVQKVYTILTAQLLLTALVASPFVFNPAVKAFARSPFGFPFMIAITIANIIFMCFLICPCGCEKNMRTFPTNYLLLGGFTITEGLLVGIVCAHYTAASIFFAVIATALVVGGLTIYAATTETDFTGMGGYLMAALLALMCFGFLCMFFPSPLMHKIYAGIGVLIFSMFLIYDTQVILGNGELCLTVDDYVFGALQLYIDIIQMFLYMLTLFGDRD